ncbi:MAG: hypothetical protein JWO36_3364 [Myxococcales bacterium]|nr:hypothetical protein [Myxococcales bacterium]
MKLQVQGLACFAALLHFTACGSSSEPAAPDAGSGSADAQSGPQFHALPFSGGQDAPVVASVQYRCSDPFGNGGGIVEAQVVITDPQGPGDVTFYTDDHLGIFLFDPPSGPEHIDSFELKADGVHWRVVASSASNAWGLLYAKDMANPQSYNNICAASTWPMDILVVDQSGHVTTGLVRGTLVGN